MSDEGARYSRVKAKNGKARKRFPASPFFKTYAWDERKDGGRTEGEQRKTQQRQTIGARV